MASNGPIKVLSAIGSLAGVAAAIPAVLDSVSHVERRGIEGDSVTWKFERVASNENNDYPIKLGDNFGRFGFCWNKKGEKKCNSNFFWGKRTKEATKSIEDELGGKYDVILMFGPDVERFKFGDFVLGFGGGSGYKCLWRSTPNGKDPKCKDGKGSDKTTIGDVDKDDYGKVTAHWCLFGPRGEELVRIKGKEDGKYGFTDLYWRKGRGWVCGTKGGSNSKKKDDGIEQEGHLGPFPLTGKAKKVEIGIYEGEVAVRDLYKETTGGGGRDLDRSCIWETSGKWGQNKSLIGDKSDTYGMCITGINQWTWVQDA